MLNSAQCAAVDHAGDSPLLVIAGAGSGKTQTLAHRVARLLQSGIDPERILLLTFSRRAAHEMTARAERIALAVARESGTARARVGWSGTFHAIANRLLRLHASEAGLDPAFTLLDRGDSADLLDLVRQSLGLAKRDKRFPKKGTCLSIYSRAVSSQEPLAKCLEDAFPWCAEWERDLRALFAAYVERKQRHHVLDFDDLLLYWMHFMSDERAAERVRRRFDRVLVDEYQDTNVLQAEILRALCPGGRGLTVVGDDAQSIYSFRAATVRNILDFPKQYERVSVVTLEQNYRSTQPLLDASNAVIGLATERFTKDLFSLRKSAQKPLLVSCADEMEQVRYVVEEILRAREAGVPLKQQAVLFRTAHHSDALEVELARRDLPFVKFGGLKFLEAAHVKDVLAILRVAENRRDTVAGFRVLQLLPGIGPATAEKALAALESGRDRLAEFPVPASAREDWAPFCSLLGELDRSDFAGQVGRVIRWYRPHLERIYDHALVREQDLEQLDRISAQFGSRERFLSELTLDPPEASGDFAGAPHLDEDYLILSTIHSAKGQEWDTVFLLNVVDGCIPSDMATSSPPQIEEERRLLYVAMTRAKNALHLLHPLRFYVHHQPRRGDAHLYAPRSRFLPDEILGHFERIAFGRAVPADPVPTGADPLAAGASIASRLQAMWKVN